jgi:hypothetical protein
MPGGSSRSRRWCPRVATAPPEPMDRGAFARRVRLFPLVPESHVSLNAVV